MDARQLRIRIIALKDFHDQIIPDVLFYVKKMINIIPEDGIYLMTIDLNSLRFSLTLESQCILSELESVRHIVVSANESFEWDIQEGDHCQILFLSKENRLKMSTDLILSFKWLLRKSKPEKMNQEIFLSVSFLLTKNFEKQMRIHSQWI